MRPAFVPVNERSSQEHVRAAVNQAAAVRSSRCLDCIPPLFFVYEYRYTLCLCVVYVWYGMSCCSGLYY